MSQTPATPVTELLAARRPRRADAARNFDAALASARAVFTEKGGGASMEAIARHAGVGIATLYRNFPTRESLIEAVYVAEVDQICRYGVDLTSKVPGEALDAWLEQFALYLNTKRALIEGLSRESEAFQVCRTAIYATGEPLLRRAQATGAARTDVDIDDVMRYIFGVTAGTYQNDDQRRRVIRMAIEAVHII
ncbi:helix-turn-helix domain-containing protein [Streptomyces sp. NPDC048489]|uniref:TetR/AcrR family transcriptional regulator n=1 Tax=Streptomyces sp. NPDC048489 TaxID=3154504 RepID=UPI0034298034